MLRSIVLLWIVLTTGCATLTLSNSQLVANQLQIRSAGFTGCAVDKNQITSITTSLDGSGTWVRPDDFLTRLNVASNRTNDCPWMDRLG
jgi:hypothetical protein